MPNPNRKINKLVRDRIPDIIREGGETPVVKTIVDDHDFIQELKRKLLEEVSEFLDSDNSAEEIADMWEVLNALTYALGLNRQSIEDLRAHKQKERGGFRNRVFLERVDPGEDSK